MAWKGLKAEPTFFQPPGTVLFKSLFFRGIGAESSRLFANEGASVVVADLNEEAAERVAQGIRDGGGNAVSVGGNVSNADHMKRMVSRAKVGQTSLNW